MKKTQSNFNKFLFVFFFVVYLFLIGLNIYLSLENGQNSSASSGRVATLIANFLNIFGNIVDPSDETFQMIVRKLVGHFGLFFLTSLFSVFSILTLKQKSKEKQIILFTSILLGITLAFLTEYLQGFSEARGPSIKDSLIDLSGYFLPLLIYLIFHFYSRFKDNTCGKMIEL